MKFASKTSDRPHLSSEITPGSKKDKCEMVTRNSGANAPTPTNFALQSGARFSDIEILYEFENKMCGCTISA